MYLRLEAEVTGRSDDLLTTISWTTPTTTASRQVSLSQISSNLNDTLVSGLSFVERCVTYAGREFLRRALLSIVSKLVAALRSFMLVNRISSFRNEIVARNDWVI